MVLFSKCLCDLFIFCEFIIIVSFVRVFMLFQVIDSLSIFYFPLNSRGDAPFKEDVHFHHEAFSYFCVDQVGFHNHIKVVPSQDFFKLVASAATNTFFQFVQTGVVVYDPRRKFQASPHSSLRFLTSCASSIIHKNHLLHLYQQSKTSVSNIKFRKVTNRCRRVIEYDKLVYSNNGRAFITQETVFLHLFANCINCKQCANRSKFAITPIFNSHKFFCIR